MSTPTERPRIEVLAPAGLGEVHPGDDLAAAFLALLTSAGEELRDGDVVVVTSKVVSKAEGRVRRGDRDAAIAEETVRVVARRGRTTIVRNRLGLTMAAAGVDASNVESGSIVLLPLDPDASARTLRERLHTLTGRTVGVVVTDTSGRAWRHGQTDIAIGAAGVRVAEDFNGRTDAYGNPLAVTLTAVVDQIAGAAELSQGKLTARPFALLRGRADLVLPRGEEGPGAAALVREEGSDLFGYGARQAVIAAVRGEDGDLAPFGEPVPFDELGLALGEAFGDVTPTDDAGAQRSVELPATAAPGAVHAVLFAHGWRGEAGPTTETTTGSPTTVWRISPRL
ncbi:MAG: coenzyme F420-0:L-glutamate ligase [Nocardioides sp.]|uniref:coenzyme F420-0:L-glutamate ligase n=1 Tax=Nocardioides sp. TaxID=35761 RepID=UPI003F07682F